MSGKGILTNHFNKLRETQLCYDRDGDDNLGQGCKLASFEEHAIATETYFARL